MAAQVLPMFDACVEEQEDWRGRCVAFLSNMLGDILKGLSMYKISDISSALFSCKADLFGQMMSAFIQKCHVGLLEQEHCTCPQCKRGLKRRGVHKRSVETMAGALELERPYFYCTRCFLGIYPLDEALGLSPASKQDDIQSVGVFLATEVSYEVARETYRRCTGQEFSEHGLHESVNRVAEGLGILDVCPSK